MGAAGTSTQGSASGATNDHLSQHQARIQAAAAAALIYEKSYVYPSANTFVWSPGYALLPQNSVPSPDSSNTESTGEGLPGGQTNFTFPQVPHHTFTPFQASNANLKHGDKSGNQNGYGSHLEAQERFIRHQIEALQTQLRLVNHQRPESINLTHSTSDSKGKAIASSQIAIVMVRLKRMLKHREKIHIMTQVMGRDKQQIYRGYEVLGHNLACVKDHLTRQEFCLEVVNEMCCLED